MQYRYNARNSSENRLCSPRPVGSPGPPRCCSDRLANGAFERVLDGEKQRCGEHALEDLRRHAFIESDKAILLHDARDRVEDAGVPKARVRLLARCLQARLDQLQRIRDDRRPKLRHRAIQKIALHRGDGPVLARALPLGQPARS